jgi:hypothetical protein
MGPVKRSSEQARGAQSSKYRGRKHRSGSMPPSLRTGHAGLPTYGSPVGGLTCERTFAFAPSIRKMIYTTNAVEALNRSLRKIIKTRGSFPNDDAALKLLYLAIKNARLRWRRGVAWTAAMGQFAIQFGARFPGSAN